MKDRSRVIFDFLMPIVILISIAAFLQCCVSGDSPANIFKIVNLVKIKTMAETGNPNMADERYELLSLVFRLARRPEFSDSRTDYQRELLSSFRQYRNHDAVYRAYTLPLGFDAVLKFAVHLEKDKNNFRFIGDIDSLLDDGRWTRESAEEFLPLLNDFYRKTGFGAFYKLHTPLYESETRRFLDEIYNQLDLEWFYKYLGQVEMCCIFSPSGLAFNYSAKVNDSIVYAAVAGNGDAVVHEFCHSFANTMAKKRYDEDSAFSLLCDSSVDLKRNPIYRTGRTMASEYMTRAFSILYDYEHGLNIIPLFLQEKLLGFPFIEEVYAMITYHEKIELDRKGIMDSVLGPVYEASAERTINIGNRVFRVSELHVPDLPLADFKFFEMGNLFDTSTGDVLCVDDEVILIDLGEFYYSGMTGFRKYCRIPL